jgi:hypothetical protein
VCAHKDSSDDDQGRPRGIADALARWDTEQGWTRSTPDRGSGQDGPADPAAQPESTPARFSPPADPRRPTPPPTVDSWDAVVSGDPRPSRSADPWGPATDEPEQELWTPPGDAVYRRVHGRRESSLPERWPSQAGASATSWTTPPAEPDPAAEVAAPTADPHAAGADRADWTSTAAAAPSEPAGADQADWRSPSGAGSDEGGLRAVDGFAREGSADDRMAVHFGRCPRTAERHRCR